MKKNGALVILLLGFVLTGRKGTSDPNLELSGVNFTNDFIEEFSVDSQYGPGIYPNGGGGKFVCCVTIPRRWRPGMKVTVQWTVDALPPDLPKQRVVTVPEYTENDFGGVVVHFYPDDTVKVLVATKIIGHPDYPYPRPE
jgi:hypothetical protein